MTASGVRVQSLTIEYVSGDYTLRPLDGFDMQATPGELVLLLGASGCGKTSLLSTLAGILTPAAGQVSVAGTDVTSLDARSMVEYRRRSVGLVFQGFNLIPSLNAAEQVAAPLRLAGVSRRTAMARARELLERVGLADRASSKPSQLSGGQQQRVAIARALAFDPPVVLADEPTAHLDYVQCEAVLVLLRELASAGRTVIISTHDDRLLPIADRVVELTPRFTAARRGRRRVSLRAGDVLFRQGDAGDVVYLVESGEIEIVRESPGGAETLLDRRREGSYVGELGPLLGLQRSATARAATDCKLKVLDAQELRGAVGDGSIATFNRRTAVAATPGEAQAGPDEEGRTSGASHAGR